MSQYRQLSNSASFVFGHTGLTESEGVAHPDSKSKNIKILPF
jgi:hypothetical protein